MATNADRRRGPQKRNNIFISWSGQNSKEFAKGLKKVLEHNIFSNTDLKCFVSDQDIASGTDWWDKIKSELRSCKLGILCITKENLRAPWVYFEAGAMVARDIPSIPLLVNCDVKSLANTPLNGKQAVDFQNERKFKKMIADINRVMGYSLNDSQLDILGKNAYVQLKRDMKEVLKKLKDVRIFNDKYVYPNEYNTIKRNTIFVSAPMSSITQDEYGELRGSMLDIKEALIDIGFTEVHCPLIDIDSPEEFDGKTKAIKDNFPVMKQVESMLVVYPWKNASSALVEMGYGIALSKKMVVFFGEGLPYIVDEAAGSIAHIKTYSFKEYDDIKQIIRSNKMALFEGSPDE